MRCVQVTAAGLAGALVAGAAAGLAAGGLAGVAAVAVAAAGALLALWFVRRRCGRGVTPNGTRT
jgi:hypothetical protein